MSKEMRQHIDKFNEFRISENLNISDVRSSFTLWDMHNAFYAGRAVGLGTDEDTRFQDLIMKYDTFDKFLKEYQSGQK
jgi:hypothetical protein